MSSKPPVHHARKRFGQHFLIDQNIIEQILAAIAPTDDQTVIEIGPGLSALTEPLCAQLKHLTAIEIDRDLVKRLRHRFSADQLTVIEADALTVDFAALAPPATKLRIVGNLPYNISTPLLFHLRTYADCVSDQHFMLQKEVVERMAAPPGSRAYGRLSVMLQQRYQITALFTVPATAFDPPPAVASAIVRMQPWAVIPEDYQPQSQAHFEAVVARAFGQRRKMLRSVLGDWYGPPDWAALEIDPTARAETLPVEAFVRMANAIAQRPLT